ncbi:hypothetical protein [Nostoc sp. ChiQUE01b]|uniref:hypothetical protein n=1 Tax=Nostoc sp. ChiQUE01b TaxID=3075376 RepID=UPI002AD326E8|nr:hypothetical protein [Nostoc sp. ChiQUE01b]MDZ8258178.1 hypothetical protein [Nostoc sp. ChiQUE01b]
MATIKISDLHLAGTDLQLSISDLEVIGSEEMDKILGGLSLTPGESLGAGIAAVALGTFIVSNPVGWVGLTAAIVSSYWGGVGIGTAIYELY